MRVQMIDRRVSSLGALLTAALLVLGCTKDGPTAPEGDGSVTSVDAPASGGRSGADGSSSPGTLTVTGADGASGDAPSEGDGQPPDRSTIPSGDSAGNPPDVSTQP